MALVPANTFIYSYNNRPLSSSKSRMPFAEASDGNIDSPGMLQTTEGDILWQELRDQQSDTSIVIENKDVSAKSEDGFERQKANLMKKIQLKQELVRGAYVEPTMVCNPGESYIDIPEFYQYMNKGVGGNQIAAQKITIT